MASQQHGLPLIPRSKDWPRKKSAENVRPSTQQSQPLMFMGKMPSRQSIATTALTSRNINSLSLGSQNAPISLVRPKTSNASSKATISAAIPSNSFTSDSYPRETDSTDSVVLAVPSTPKNQEKRGGFICHENVSENETQDLPTWVHMNEDNDRTSNNIMVTEDKPIVAELTTTTRTMTITGPHDHVSSFL
jgi:hypothetical protein